VNSHSLSRYTRVLQRMHKSVHAGYDFGDMLTKEFWRSRFVNQRINFDYFESCSPCFHDRMQFEHLRSMIGWYAVTVSSCRFCIRIDLAMIVREHNLLLNPDWFLGAFAWPRKAPVIFVKCLCSSVCLDAGISVASTWMDFGKILHLGLTWKSDEKIVI
jgi:hypothetical protein